MVRAVFVSCRPRIQKPSEYEKARTNELAFLLVVDQIREEKGLFI